MKSTVAHKNGTKTARFNFAKEHEKEPNEYWLHMLNPNKFGSDEVQNVWRRLDQDHSDCLVLTAKHESGSVLIRGSRSAKGVTMNYSNTK